jgi:hypothetical protein
MSGNDHLAAPGVFLGNSLLSDPVEAIAASDSTGGPLQSKRSYDGDSAKDLLRANSRSGGSDLGGIEPSRHSRVLRIDRCGSDFLARSAP